MSAEVGREAHKPRRIGSAEAGVKIERSFAPKSVAGEALRRRAIEAVIWGLPAVNFDLLRGAAVKAGAEPNQIVFWSGLPSWKNQTLTPNADTLYFLALFDTHAGPVVLEIPPATDDASITGSIDDCWQTALADVGPAGADKGAGGRYLILPPDHSGDVPNGYIPLTSTNYTGFALLRSNLRSASVEDVDEAVAYGKRVRLYPFSTGGGTRPTTFVDVRHEMFDSTIRYDARFFESLDRIVQTEPWLERDRAMIDTLKTLGIQKGKAFTPDQTIRRRLGEAAREAHAWLQSQYELVFDPPFDAGARWAFPVSPELAEGLQTGFAKTDNYPLDARGLTYSFVFFSAKYVGAGQYYLMTIRDKDGEPLHGSATYRLRVPPDPPVRLYWSATVYDRETHAFIRGAERVSRSSLSPELALNSDGSADVIFGPRPLVGADGHWIATHEGRDFEVLFRLYGPEPRFFEKTWVLPDIEKVS